MDGGADELDITYGVTRTQVAEGEWAGWSCYPEVDPFEDLAGSFYWRRGPDGRPVCAFRAERKHMNASGFMHGGCVMAFADFALFVIAAEAIVDGPAVTATFNCELVGTARAGDLIECRGEVVKAGRSMVFVRGIVSNASTAEPMASFSSALKKTGSRKGLHHSG